MRYPSSPEFPISTEIIDKDGEIRSYSDSIASISVSLDNANNRNGQLQFEIKGYPKKGDLLVIRASLPTFTAAITSATLHREDNRE
jgi:hypothetical protein